MLLTKKSLRNYIEQNRQSISKEKELEVLEILGTPAVDDEGYARGYTEQDIYEQLRKLI